MALWAYPVPCFHEFMHRRQELQLAAESWWDSKPRGTLVRRSLYSLASEARSAHENDKILLAACYFDLPILETRIQQLFNKSNYLADILAVDFVPISMHCKAPQLWHDFEKGFLASMASIFGFNDASTSCILHLETFKPGSLFLSNERATAYNTRKKDAHH